MPLTLTTPVEVASAKKDQATVLEIVEHQVGASFALVWLGRREGAVVYPIPGFLKIEDVPATPGLEEGEEDPGRTYSWGGRTFVVAPGDYLSAAVGAAPSGGSVYAVVKNALYGALQAMYGLGGTVS